ncbi:MAG: hypothetical protein ACI9PN_000283 [Candidatus Azotimanducaceae bacterium]|jgi:hypothetical protein
MMPWRSCALSTALALVLGLACCMAGRVEFLIVYFRALDSDIPYIVLGARREKCIWCA